MLRFKGGERRRNFPATVYVGPLPGAPGAAAYRVGPADGLDDALRTDIVGALLTRAGELAAPVCWLTRVGEPVPHDLDVEWSFAARQAFAERGVPGCFLVLTKRGWYEPGTGERRTWKRLRDRRAK